MESGNGLILIIIGIVVGIVAGFLLEKLRNRSNNKDEKLVALQKEFDDYRANVREHYIDTVSIISKIDEQQKELYRSVGEGVKDLCQLESGKDDYFLEQTMETLGELEPPKKDEKRLPNTD